MLGPEALLARSCVDNISADFGQRERERERERKRERYIDPLYGSAVEEGHGLRGSLCADLVSCMRVPTYSPLKAVMIFCSNPHV